MRIVDSTATPFTTGNDPGNPKQTAQTWVLAGAPKAVGHAQNILDAVPNSTCVSKPSTGSNSVNAASKSM
jgi:hypothetical protein